MATRSTTPEYAALQKCYKSIIAVVKIDPGSLCDALFSKDIIPESIRDFTRNVALLDEDKARKLIDTVIDQIKEDPIVFHHFLETLKSSHYDSMKTKLTECYQTEKSKKDNSSVKQSCSTEIPSEHEVSLADPRSSNTVTNNESDTKSTNTDTSFLCPYCENCSVEQYLSDEGCPKATGKTLFPYLNTPNLSEEDKTVLEFNLISATKDLKMLFTKTDTYIAKNLCADVTVVKNFALDLVRDMEQEDNEAKLEAATTIPEIILSLHPYKSFLNYEIIESIANEFGTPDIRAEMQKYVAAFNDFCKRSAYELPVNVLPKKVNKRKEKILSVKLTKRGLASIRDIVSVQLNMATILSVKTWALKICSIEKGCICVRFLVPAAVMSKILLLSPDKKSALRDANISIGVAEQIVPSTSEANNRLDEKIIPTSSKFLVISGVSGKEGHTPLLAACKNGDTETAQLLIDKGADVNQCDEEEQSPLFAACWSGHTETAQLLIDKGADVNKCDQQSGQSPLLAAIIGGHPETAQLLIDKGADVNKCDQFGRSPLLAAIIEGHTETAQLLIDKGADVNKCDQFGQSPLSAASEGGHTETAQLLINKGADVNKCSERPTLRCPDFNFPFLSVSISPLLAACRGGHNETAQLLIDKGADVNKCDQFGQSPFLAASEGGHTETAQLLIDKGADVNKCDQFGQSPLLAACQGDHTETAQLLIDKGADVNKCDQSGRSPLLAASKGGHTETAQLLIDKGVDVNKCDQHGTTLLQDACKRGDTETTKLLIDNGADVNKCDKYGMTLLQDACKRGDTETAKLLIDIGADVNECDKYGMTLLQDACKRGDTATAKLLIDNGADVNKCDKYGWTPLQAAFEEDHLETAQMVIDKGADVNQCDKDGRSPLLASCERGHTKSAILLIEKGADVNKCDTDERSPLLGAAERGHTGIVQLLINEGADVNKCDRFGNSPLKLAKMGDIEDLLMKNGAEDAQEEDHYSYRARRSHSKFICFTDSQVPSDSPRAAHYKAASTTTPLDSTAKAPPKQPWSVSAGMTTADSGIGSTESGFHYKSQSRVLAVLAPSDQPEESEMIEKSTDPQLKDQESAHSQTTIPPPIDEGISEEYIEQS